MLEGSECLRGEREIARWRDNRGTRGGMTYIVTVHEALDRFDPPRGRVPAHHKRAGGAREARVTPLGGKQGCHEGAYGVRMRGEGNGCG